MRFRTLPPKNTVVITDTRTTTECFCDALAACADGDGLDDPVRLGGSSFRWATSVQMDLLQETLSAQSFMLARACDEMRVKQPLMLEGARAIGGALTPRPRIRSMTEMSMWEWPGVSPKSCSRPPSTWPGLIHYKFNTDTAKTAAKVSHGETSELYRTYSPMQSIRISCSV